MTQQPRSVPRFENFSTPTTSSNDPQANSQQDSSVSNFSRTLRETQTADCECSDDEIEEISEKRRRIFNSNPGPSGCSSSHVKVTHSSSSDSSSFEEVEPKLIDENWEVIEKAASSTIESRQTKQEQEVPIDEIMEAVGIGSQNDETFTSTSELPSNPEVRKLTRRRSDSSLLSLKKSKSIFLDTSDCDLTKKCNSEVNKLKVSCNNCGKAKSNIKLEILKLSEQLKSSNKSESEVNAKIKEFLVYLESKSQTSAVSGSNQNDASEGEQFVPITLASPRDEIGENMLEEINADPLDMTNNSNPSSQNSTPRRFISLSDIRSKYRQFFNL